MSSFSVVNWHESGSTQSSTVITFYVFTFRFFKYMHEAAQTQATLELRCRLCIGRFEYLIPGLEFYAWRMNHWLECQKCLMSRQGQQMWTCFTTESRQPFDYPEHYSSISVYFGQYTWNSWWNFEVLLNFVFYTVGSGVNGLSDSIR
jgi:hypothetical protein